MDEPVTERNGSAPRLGLVGKTVTFDSGGISLKPPASMPDMKMDMSGGAAVLEATAAIAELGLAVELTAVLPVVENMPSGTATRPGDVKDGLSNTFALGETTMHHVNGAAFAWAYRTWVMTGIDPGTSDPGINHWHLPHVHPAWQSPPFEPVVGRLRTWWAAAGSLHTGGCYFALGDGSVRFVSDQTDTTTLERLCRIADGQVVSVP